MYLGKRNSSKRITTNEKRNNTTKRGILMHIAVYIINKYIYNI